MGTNGVLYVSAYRGTDTNLIMHDIVLIGKECVTSYMCM